MNRSIWLAVLMACMGAAAEKPITVQESSRERVVFTWKLSSYSASTVRADNGAATELSSPDANVEIGAVGETIVPGRSFHVGLPPGGRATVSVVPLEVATRPLQHPPTRRDSSANPELYRTIQFDQPWVSRGAPARFGRLGAAAYVLRPFVWDEAAGVLRVLKRARVEVRFSGETHAYAPPSGGPYEPVLRRLLLNYDIARMWRTPAVSSSLRKAARDEYPLRPSRTLAWFEIGDGHSGLNETTTNENGLVRISGQSITAVLGNNLAIERVALWAAQMGELPWSPPEPAEVPSRLVRIPVMRFDVDQDGILDNNDYLVAFVTGASDWLSDTTNNGYSFLLNRYDDYRGYWLTYGGTEEASSMRSYTPPASPADVALTSFRAHVRHKRPRLKPSDGRKGTLDLVWDKFSIVNTSMSYVAELPGLNRDSAGIVDPSLGTVRGNGAISLRFGGTELTSRVINGQELSIDSWGGNDMQITYVGPSKVEAFAELEHLDFEYVHELSLAHESRFTVYSPVEPGIVEYRLSGIPSGELVYIVRVPQDESRISLVDTLRLADGGTYTWKDTAGIGVRYHICREAAFQAAPEVNAFRSGNTGRHALVDLHAGSVCDFLIVTSEELLEPAERLAEHKEESAGFRAARVVTMRDVYREFSGGVVDPAALRNMLTYAKGFWPQPERMGYVVLLGLGNWDYKHVTSRETIHVPVAQSGTGRTQFCSERFFTGDSSNFFLGRLPCADEFEADAVVDKIIDMEQVGRADFGAWRNRILMAADNDRQQGRVDNIGHHRSSERITRRIQALRPTLEINKLYLFEYGLDERWSSPAARQAMIAELNGGVGYVNYFGHGGENVWADEFLLHVDDMVKLSNLKRYPIVGSLSCSVGRFDEPGHNCLSDQIVRIQGAGAIAIISSTREAWASANEDLAESFYDALFDTAAPMSVGQAYDYARNLRIASSVAAFCLLGDPSITIAEPTRGIDVRVSGADGSPLDSLKVASADTSEGDSTTYATLQALQRITISGTVTRQGARDTDFGSASDPAYIQLGLYNPSDTATRKDGITTHPVTYTLPGSPVFVGRTPVVNGTFEQDALIPRSVSFDKPGVKLIAYAWDDPTIGVGCDTSLLFHGTEEGAPDDTVGPMIALRLTDNGAPIAYTDGFSTILPFSCDIVVMDENGVDVVKSGPDEGLTVDIPGIMSKQSINHAFQFREGDYREGFAPFTIDEGVAQPGTYQMTITARDLLENMSALSVELTISAADELTLDHLFNYPNPVRMRETTRFYYNLPNSPVLPPAAVTLRIYSLSGKLLRTIKQLENGYEWDGRDQFGNQLGPNVYLYRVSAWSHSGSSDPLQSPIRKLVIHPPR